MLIKVGKEDDSKTVEKILAKQEKILDKQEGNGGTARVLANNNNHLEVVKLLLTERATVNTHHQEEITLRKTIERNNIADIPHQVIFSSKCECFLKKSNLFTHKNE